MVTLGSRRVGLGQDDRERIRTLTADDVPRLRLGWRNRHDVPEILRVLSSYPGRSVWAPLSGEFALVGPWRHRAEVAVVQELAAVREVPALIEGVAERGADGGAALVLMVELDERRRSSFYDRIGFDALDEVVAYELERPPVSAVAWSPLRFVPLSASDGDGIAEAVRIDHAAFAWLWWNSEREFGEYAAMAGVEVFLGLRDGVPVSYVGVTTYPGWGHLDRMAVHPVAQGSGIGRRSLAFAVEHLARRGARRVALSTQQANRRSQRLYERFGFRRTGGNDYRLYGRWLVDPRGLPGRPLDP